MILFNNIDRFLTRREKKLTHFKVIVKVIAGSLAEDKLPEYTSRGQMLIIIK